MASLKYSANLELMTVTLASDYTAASSSMSLTAGHGARLPASGDFWLRTTSGTYRCFKVTARSTDTLTVVAAQDGTEDGNLSAGVELKWVLGVTAIDQLRSDLIQTGADASKAVTKAGSLYLPNDGMHLYRDSGAVMVPWGPIFPCTAHDDSGFSWINQGSATVAATDGRVYISSTADSTNHFNVRKKAKTGTYTITVGILPHMLRVNYPGCGIGWRQSSDGKLVLFMLIMSGSPQLSIIKQNSPSSTSSSYVDVGINESSTLMWLRIADNGTSRICSWSVDGINFQVLHTVGRTDFITGDEVLYSVRAMNATYGCGATIFSWKEE